MSDTSCIRMIGARQHNLRGVSVTIPRGRLTVVTGPSGSGKSSLAFDTLYAEGQRRYVESLSAYARQFLEQLPKPDVDRIEGLTPTLAIEQRGAAPGRRSTVATTTEIYDYLRVLFARLGRPHCPVCDRVIAPQPVARMVEAVLADPTERRILVLAPLVQDRRGSHQQRLQQVARDGFTRVRINGEVHALDAAPPLDARRRHTIEVVVDRLVVRPEIRQRLTESIELATRTGNGRVVVASQSSDERARWVDERFSASLCCPDHPEGIVPELTPQLFSFNSPHGACPECHGLGIRLEFDPDLVLPDLDRSLADGAVAAWQGQGKRLRALYADLIAEFCDRFRVLPDAPVRTLPATLVNILLHGTTKTDEERHGASFEGILPNLRRRWENTDSDALKQRLHAFLGESSCPACLGTRLRPEARLVRLGDLTITALTALTIREARDRLESFSFPGDESLVAGPLLRALHHRLRYLGEAGLEYLALDRTAASLSGGEWQRIRLATQIGGGLAGVCYVLDEPTIGLHPRDSRRLAAILRNLTEMGNTVVVVEHDEEVIAHADHLIDVGPGAGCCGGTIVAEGPPDHVLRHPTSLTSRFLRGEISLPVPRQRRAPDDGRCIELTRVTANNLKNLSVRFPLGLFVCVTGVSGSGKSSLVSDVLLRALRRVVERRGPRPGPHAALTGAEHVERVVEVDQSPLGRTPRGNPATYVGVFDLIRKLYARTRTARVRGYGPERFSFNVRGGRCEACRGQGTRRVAMHFLPDVFVTCPECNGARYNPQTLEIRYRGKSIADILNLSVEEASTFFEPFRLIHNRIQLLRDVGLGYVALGQPSNTLSGGEAQRIKLAAELQRGGDGHTVYLLDEPTTGLHFGDVRQLMAVLNRLVDRGDTVLCVEHNLDVIKCADWVIDLGPEGGDDGGRIVAEGTPEQIAACPASHTGRFLQPRLRGDPPLSIR